MPTPYFLFPRRVSVARQHRSDQPGEQADYSGMTATSEEIVLSDLPAHIEVERQGSAAGAKLPSDTAGQSIWIIIVKVRLGLIKRGDILIDDQGLRYYVVSPDWGPLVTSCRSQILET